MKWAFSIEQKFKAAALLAGTCGIVLVTNLLGRQHIDKLGNSFSSVYEDRLVVESYIYELSEHLYRKKLLLDNCAGPSAAQLDAQVGAHNAAIDRLLVDYEKTRLTEEETVSFHGFKADVAALRLLEGQYLDQVAGAAPFASSRSRLDARFALAASKLHRLSQIQIQEGKLLNDQSQRIVRGSSLLTSFEMAALVAIALILQALVLASRPVASRIRQQGSLN